MSKAPLYVVARAGGRPEKTVVKTALDHFISTGAFVGSPELAVEIMNCAIEHGWDFTTSFNRESAARYLTVAVKRVR